LDEGKNINFSIVLSYIGEKAISNYQEFTILPEGLELSLPRFAISKRNEWMLRQAKFAIVYVNHRFSNSHKWIEKASKKRIDIINLSDTYEKEP